NEAEIQALEEIIRKEEPTLVVVDSIQTMYSENLDSLPGSVGQIRDCSQRLLQLAKALGTTILIIGHVTKEGILAGPRMLEHMVDTVLYLEGDERYDHRMLRSVKNRFGATHEIGVFRMSSAGLEEVTNPSRLFLQERLGDVSGTVIYPSLEGTRPILVEVQALVTPARFGTPQRTANGLDFRRVSMLLAVLEKRLQRPLGMRDVFVNIVGGLKIDDPAADLAVIAAIVSSEQDRPVPEGMVLVGEVGLGGEVRNVTRLEQRLREAQELGCTRALVPKRSSVKSRHFDRLQLHPVLTVQEALAQLFRDR
ncbi:MAG: DNA repair protein RadA, partial [Candidatus Neomarinimicrobiota bacterium]